MHVRSAKEKRAREGARYLLEIGRALSDRRGDGNRVRGVCREDWGGAVVSAALGRAREEHNILSVSGGIHGSTEYGKLSIRAQMPRMAECSVRRELA